jgi:hypothetical protein
MPYVTDEDFRPLMKAVRLGDPTKARFELDKLFRQLDETEKVRQRHAAAVPLSGLQGCLGASG